MYKWSLKFPKLRKISGIHMVFYYQSVLIKKIIFFEFYDDEIPESDICHFAATFCRKIGNAKIDGGNLVYESIQEYTAS